jgi:hypothetical protein
MPEMKIFGVCLWVVCPTFCRLGYTWPEPCIWDLAVTELSEEALHNLCYNALTFADNLFQMWLTVTFAAILAIYFSHSNITPYLRRLLIGLYFGASVMLIGRWWVAIFFHFLTYQSQLIEHGWLPFPTPKNAQFLGVLHLLLYLLGTGATLYFMAMFVGPRKTKLADKDSE